MLLIFLVSWVVFDVIFVRLWPLTKRGWKKVDYVVVGVAAVGILGAAGTIRREIAKNFQSTAETRARTSYEFARYQMGNLSAPFICRTFEKTELSPPNLSELQAEFDRVCAFGRAALNKIPTEMPKETGFPDVGAWPDVKSGMLTQVFTEDKQAIDRYRATRETFDKLRGDAEYSALDSNLFFLTPLLIAVALALRMTKVTGELRPDL